MSDTAFQKAMDKAVLIAASVCTEDLLHEALRAALLKVGKENFTHGFHVPGDHTVLVYLCGELEGAKLLKHGPCNARMLALHLEWQSLQSHTKYPPPLPHTDPRQHRGWDVYSSEVEGVPAVVVKTVWCKKPS